jgi:hypothetical protein
MPTSRPEPALFGARTPRSGWQPIPGTGCAHYVAHQKNIRNGTPGQKCVAGYTFRVQPCLTGLTQVAGGLGAVQVGDIWVSPSRDHTGIVTSVVPPAAGTAPNTPPAISITHASSGQHKPATNLYATYFHGAGDFFRCIRPVSPVADGWFLMA